MDTSMLYAGDLGVVFAHVIGKSYVDPATLPPKDLLGLMEKMWHHKAHGVNVDEFEGFLPINDLPEHARGFTFPRRFKAGASHARIDFEKGIGVNTRALPLWLRPFSCEPSPLWPQEWSRSGAEHLLALGPNRVEKWALWCSEDGGGNYSRVRFLDESDMIKLLEWRPNIVGKFAQVVAHEQWRYVEKLTSWLRGAITHNASTSSMMRTFLKPSEW